jgi:diacylglycerol kinase (ATP)
LVNFLRSNNTVAALNLAAKVRFFSTKKQKKRFKYTVLSIIPILLPKTNAQTMSHTLFLINGALSNKNKMLQRLHQAFAKGIEYTVLETQYAQHAIQLLSEAAQSRKYTHFIAIGGDGSLNEMINGIMQGYRLSTDLNLPVTDRYDWSALAEITMGMMKAGSGNDFSRSINAPDTFEELRKSIEQNKTKTIDIGYAQYTSTTMQLTERFFMNITDVGLGGAVAVRISDRKTRWLSPQMMYNTAIVQTFFTYNKNTVACTNTDGFEWKGKAMSVIAANGKYFASGLGIAPDAELDSGKLQLVILGDITLFDYFMQLPTAMRCKHIKHKQVWYHTVSDITISPVDAPLPIDMDGEFVGYAPLSMRKFKQCLRFVVL